MMNQHDIALAFDFGGTKLAAALVDTVTGDIVGYSTCLTPEEKTASSSLNAIMTLGNTLLANNKTMPPSHIGISFGGSIAKDRRSVNRSVHIEGWDQFPLTEHLEQHYSLPAFMDNDANIAALGEWAFGAGERADSMLYVQLSTGIGAGLILHGQVWRGEGLAGEFGHMKSFGCDDPCVCGQQGCLESSFAGWAIQKAGQKLYQENPSGTALSRLSGDRLTEIDAQMVFQAMRSGDPGATRIIHAGVDKLGVALSNAINLLDPAIIVIGGGISKSLRVFRERLNHCLKANVIRSIYAHINIRQATLQGKETLIGAAVLQE